MKLTPLDIKKQEFKKNLRGYDPFEVDTFLEMVADEFENVIRDKMQLEEEVVKLRQQLTDYQQVEKTLKETLVNAQENLNASRQNSKREADLILREAEIKAEKIVEEARRKLEKIRNDLVIIKAQKESFARRLRHLLESQLELIGVLEMDDSGYEEEDQGEPEPEAPAGKRPEREGWSRKRVEIPPLGVAAEEAEERDGREKTDAEPENNKKESKPRIPRISDQFIT